MLTKFQSSYLKNLIGQKFNGHKIDRIIFAVTSSNHSNTRRNPIPLYLRALAIEKFSRDFPCEIKIYPIPDVKMTEQFAKYLLGQIYYQGGEKLTPKNTLIACSTPDVIKLFKKLKFKNFPVELINEKKDKYKSLRPYEVIDILVKSGKNWRNDNDWKNYSSNASQDIYLEYNLGDLIIELFKDSLISEDADITETRDYNTYAKGMDQNVEFKFNDIKPFISEGKIVDAGCGTGALVYLLAKNFPESDIIGIEATRKFYEYCKLQEYPNPFVYFYRRNIIDQNFKDKTINSFIYSSILHEIYSYIGEKQLIEVLKNTFNQLSIGGRIIIRDVVGPENRNKEVYLELNEKDGASSGELKSLSTSAKFHKFVKDFKPRKIKFHEIKFNNKKLIKLKLVDAYEFISKMNYIDNWQSEMNEEFGFWNFKEWKLVLKKIGFDIVEGSKEFKSQYIIDKMYKDKVKIFKIENKNLFQIDYPSTNMILVGEKLGHK